MAIKSGGDPIPHPSTHISMFANSAWLGSGVRVRIREQRTIKRRSKALRVRIREQRTIKRRSKALLSL